MTLISISLTIALAATAICILLYLLYKIIKQEAVTISRWKKSEQGLREVIEHQAGQSIKYATNINAVFDPNDLKQGYMLWAAFTENYTAIVIRRQVALAEGGGMIFTKKENIKINILKTMFNGQTVIAELLEKSEQAGEKIFLMLPVKQHKILMEYLPHR